MNRSASCIVLAVLTWAVGGCTTSDTTTVSDVEANGAPRVHVIFANPQTFTDARSRLGGDADPGNLDLLGRLLVREATPQLAPGERLTIVFEDVDLAGDFTPGDFSPTGDVRVVREIQPPRLKFLYTIIDETDTVVEEGEVTLTNRDFLRDLRASHTQMEPLHHEKEMLREWVRKTLSKRRAARSEAGENPAGSGEQR